MGEQLTIGQVAKRAGVNVETVRYYQRRGLLAEPAMPPGGHRRYPEAAVQRLRFIKRAQALGFTLEEIAGLLHLDAACACAQTRELAAHKLELIERKIAGLVAMREVLGGLVRQCDREQAAADCPIIHALTQE